LDIKSFRTQLVNYAYLRLNDLSCLVSLPIEDGGFYYVVADTFFSLEDGTQIVYFYGEQSIVSTESSVVETSDDQSFYDAVTSNMDILSKINQWHKHQNSCQR
jgi:hypothetical protein